MSKTHTKCKMSNVMFTFTLAFYFHHHISNLLPVIQIAMSNCYTFVKGALQSFGEEVQTQNLNVYNINEVETQTLFPITE